MDAKLMVSVKLHREEFLIEDYKDTDDILMLVESGEFTLNDRGNIYTVGPFDAAFFAAGKQYYRKVIKDLDIFLFRFSCREKIFDKGLVTFKDKNRIRSTIALLNEIKRRNVEALPAKEVLLNDLINQYEIENAEKIMPGDGNDLVINTAVDYMRENYTETISLGDLAEQANLSYVQFSRRFKAETGKTPSAYLSDIRISAAERLLTDTDIPVSQVAANCGFQNEYYFSRFFKKHNRVPPSVFRKSIK